MQYAKRTNHSLSRSSVRTSLIKNVKRNIVLNCETILWIKTRLTYAMFWYVNTHQSHPTSPTQPPCNLTLMLLPVPPVAARYWHMVAMVILILISNANVHESLVHLKEQVHVHKGGWDDKGNLPPSPMPQDNTISSSCSLFLCAINDCHNSSCFLSTSKANNVPLLMMASSIAMESCRRMAGCYHQLRCCITSSSSVSMAHVECWTPYTYLQIWVHSKNAIV